MFSPSEQKILGASVGIKDGTSTIKFKDTKLSYFFGNKGGLPKSIRIKENEIFHDSSNSLLQISASISPDWLHVYTSSIDAEKKATDANNRASNTDEPSGGSDQRLWCEKDLCYLIPMLLVALVVTKRAEQIYFSYSIRSFTEFR